MDFWTVVITVALTCLLAEIGFRALFYPKLLKKAKEELVKQLGEMVEANDEVTITIVRNEKKVRN